MLIYSANISTMFTEDSVYERFFKARKYGFNYIEMQFPYEYDYNKLHECRLESGVRGTLINSYVSNEYPFGMAATPLKEIQFLMDLHKVTPICNALGAKRVHIMAGLKSKEFTFEDQLCFYKNNLISAASFLEEQDLVGVIEPICEEVVPDYFLSSFDVAVEVIREVNSEYIRLLLDVYHLHKITGDVKKYLDIYYPYAAHIQVSQDPGRCEPFYPGGQIDYDYVFSYLQRKGFSEPIGLEYFPSDDPKAINWFQSYVPGRV